MNRRKTAASPVYSWWTPPPAPLDVWASQRCTAPATDDFVRRHRRGVIRMPFDLQDAHEPKRAGDLVTAWVCCDPACGGVELSEHGLQREHRCCVPVRTCADCTMRQCCPRHPPARRHMAGTGHTWFTGFVHGMFTPFWEPDTEQPATQQDPSSGIAPLAPHAPTHLQGAEQSKP